MQEMVYEALTNKISEKVTELKIIPPVAFKIIQLISNERTTMNEFENLIGFDPVLTARLIRHVNSPIYNLKEKVGSISRASFFVGLKDLRTIACSALRHIYQNEIMENIFLKRKLWLHSTSVGLCAQLIYKRILSYEGEDGLVAGLVHDIGLIVVTQIIEETFKGDIIDYKKGFSSIFESQEDMIDDTHCLIGEYIARQCSFPENIVQVIRDHHRPSTDIINLKDLYEIVLVAHHIVKHLGFVEVPEIVEKGNENIVDHFETYKNDYRLLIKELVSEIQKPMSFYEVSRR